MEAAIPLCDVASTTDCVLVHPCIPVTIVLEDEASDGKLYTGVDAGTVVCPR